MNQDHLQEMAFASQRQNRMGCAQLQALKVYRRLEGEGNWRGRAPPKPKWTCWQTFERFANKLDHYNARFDGVRLVHASRFLER